MSDFLTTLIAFQRGELRALQPRLPARYESALPNNVSPAEPLVEEYVERDAAPMTRPLTQIERASPRVPPAPYRGSLSAPTAQENPRTREAPDHTPDPIAARTPPTQARAKDVTAPAAIPRAPNRAQVPEPPEEAQGPRVIIRENMLQPKSAVVAQPIVRIVRESPTQLAGPAARTASSQRNEQESTLPPAPTVRVTIGRILVRATQAPPPRESRRAAPAPKLSLDDYLKARERGER